MINKTKAEVYREALRDVPQNFEGAENFIEQQIEEICEQKKISLKSYSIFIYFLYIFCA